MALLDLCSNNSYWRGLDYYENKRVKNLNQISKYEFEAEVEGTKVYQVHLDAMHQRRCTCSCPHAAGRYVVCKHKVAVFFAAFPEEAQKAIDERNRYFEEQEEREREYDRRVKAERKRVREYVNSLDENKAKRLLINYMTEEAIRNIEDPYEDEDIYW